MKLEDLVPKKRACVHEGFDNWRDAVAAACQPLIDDKAIEPEYVDAIIECIEKYGPYIVIAPDICIPHAQEGKGVNETCMGFMKTHRPVQFGETEDTQARLFFVLASENSDLHMNNIQMIADYLSDGEFVQKLIGAAGIDDLYH